MYAYSTYTCVLVFDLHSRDEPTIFLERWLGPILCSNLSSRTLREDPQLFQFNSYSVACLDVRFQHDCDSFFCVKVLTLHSKELSNSLILAHIRPILGGRPCWRGSSVNYRLIIQ